MSSSPSLSTPVKTSSAAAARSGESLPGILREIAGKYPDALRETESHPAQIARIAEHIEWVKESAGVRARVCDIGGGIGLFSIGCAAVGMDSVLLDDFNDPVNREVGAGILDLHRSYGVRVLSMDALAGDFPFAAGSLDAVTTFDSMEHWHRSPKQLFASVMRALVPGGLLIIGVPNCVNLRKRLTVPLGRGKWSTMQLWYEEERFRGHVREPDVDDLRYIAQDIGLTGVRIVGRNWLGYDSPRLRSVMPLIDPVLRLRPSLCSNIYLIGHKPR